MSSETIDQPAPRPSGIVTTDNNERVIPATRRADGTLRKERRVRPGFVPQEDVARYKNRWVAETTPPPPPPKPDLPKMKAQKKNEKRVLKKKEKRELEGDLNNENQQLVGNNELLGQLQNKMSEMSINKSIEFIAETEEKATITIEQLENTTKKIKALEKKIRQIERIKEKKARDESLKEDEEDKLNKLEQIQEELRRLKQGDDDE